MIVDDWIPIGGIDANEEEGFARIFGGNGHTVTVNGFDMAADNTRVGLFRLISETGVVKNLLEFGRHIP